MAQIAIPLVVVGVLYLISNDKKNEQFINQLELADVSTDPNADKLNKKDINGKLAKDYFVAVNTALGGNARDFEYKLDAAGNFLPSTNNTNTTNAALNNSALNNIKGFQDPNKKYPSSDYTGVSDINKLAVGDVTHKSFNVKKNKKIDNIQLANSKQTWNEPDSAYGAGYPYNQVTETEAGHLIELDSTPGA